MSVCGDSFALLACVLDEPGGEASAGGGNVGILPSMRRTTAPTGVADKRFLTTGDVAEMCGVNYRTVIPELLT